MDINTAFRKLEELFAFFFFIFIFLPGCSHVEQKKSMTNTRVKKSRVAENNLDFMILEKVLVDQSTQKNFWVDLNGDNQEDLVSLRENYSSPRVFLRFGEELKPTKKGFYFPDGLMASGLVFTDLNSNNKKIEKTKFSNKPICIIIGPEGDFSEHERQEILSFKGVQALKINDNILRSETAVISAISIINYVIN